MSSIVLIAALTFSLAQVHGSEWGDVPALKGLDFSNVEIYPLIAVHTRNADQDTSQLFSHTIARLAEHKLVGISPDRKDPKPLKNPRLIITLLAKEIPDCPDKLLYVRNLELRERAVREREPKVYTDGISFGGTDLLPEVIDVSAASRDRFEKDLDQMIDRFAQHYWEWNGKNTVSQ
jgi:hypothetical protein